MTFQPVLPLSGLNGWAFLKRTEATQMASFSRQPMLQRDEAYFRERISSVRTAEALVDDRRLLRITLEAFGLEADLNAKAFIRKVLEDGTLTTGALANRLTDKRYLELSAAFGFGDFSTPRTALSDFADGILSRWKVQRFEAAVGSVNGDMRLAMNVRREIAAVASSAVGENTKWFRVLGSPPIWSVMRGALGLPASFGSLDLDQQLAGLKARANAVFGSDSVSQFTDSAKVEKLIQRFLVGSGMESNRNQNSAALMILQQSRALMRRL